MQRKTDRALRLASGLLVGGMATGLLLAMTVPTTMRQNAADSWRELVRAPDDTYDEPAAFAAAPEDLSPVYWQTAAAEYPAGADPWRDPSADWQQDASIPAYEPLPAQLLEVREQGDRGASIEYVQLDDDAASNAQAAQAAAADVRMVESATVETAAPATIEPQAVAATT